MTHGLELLSCKGFGSSIFENRGLEFQAFSIFYRTLVPACETLKEAIKMIDSKGTATILLQSGETEKENIAVTA